MKKIWVLLTTGFNPPYSLFNAVFPIKQEVGESWKVIQKDKKTQTCRIVISISEEKLDQLRIILTGENVLQEYGVINSGLMKGEFYTPWPK